MRNVMTGLAVAGLALVMTASCKPVVRCGAVITKDTTLTSDVVGCAGNALSIGADGIRLDLNGHTIESVDDVGIRIAGRRNVQIDDGTIRGRLALRAIDTQGLVIRRTAIEGGQNDFSDDVDLSTKKGLVFERVSRSRISDSSVTAYLAVTLQDSHDNQLNRVVSRGDVDNSGQLLLSGSDRNVLTDSVFASAGGQNGLLNDSHYNRLERNNFSNSNGGALALRKSDHNIIRGNMTGSESTGLRVQLSIGNVIENNQGTGSFGGGPATGIDVFGSQDTVLKLNRVGPITILSSTATQVRDNVVTKPSFGDDGILVASDSTKTQVRGNLVSAFEDDGIDVDAPGTIVTGNTADDNGALGIEAVPGVVDGGGNRASRNGDPAQCLNITCNAS